MQQVNTDIFLMISLISLNRCGQITVSIRPGEAIFVNNAYLQDNINILQLIEYYFFAKTELLENQCNVHYLFRINGKYIGHPVFQEMPYISYK